MPEVEIEIKRKVITYSDFWTTSEILYGHGCDEEKGSYYLFLSSLVFSAFSLEAYLNHVGEHIFISWSDLEKLGIKAKLNVISERLEGNNRGQALIFPKLK